MRPLRTKTKVLADEYKIESPIYIYLDLENNIFSNLITIYYIYLIYGGVVHYIYFKKIKIKYKYKIYYRTLNRHRFVGRVY